MLRLSVILFALVALVGCGMTVAQDPLKPVVSETATGQPVISANANEIQNIHEGPAPQVAPDAGNEAEQELRQTLQIEQRKRVERVVKHNQEQSFKSRENEKKADTREIRRERFEEHMKRKKEEGRKQVREQSNKNNAAYKISEKLADKKMDAELSSAKRESTVDMAKVDADRGAWETKVDLENKALMEETRKGKEGQLKQQAEQDRKTKRKEANDKQKMELKAKREAQKKREESDFKAVHEKARKHNAQKEETSKSALKEQERKEQQHAEDQANERREKASRKKFEMLRKQRENKRKALEKKEKSQEREEKTKEKEKKAKLVAEEKSRKSAVTTWCECSNSNKAWTGYNSWYSCPSDKLAVGINRNWYWWHWSGLNHISYIKCCAPCRGSAKVPIVHCQDADWMLSFDRRGWSNCPANYYIQGFYKSSCNWIFCLEKVKCCMQKGSRGYKGSARLKNWHWSMMNAGTSQLTKHYWMTGLWRDWCYQLQCMRHANEVQAFAWTT